MDFNGAPLLGGSLMILMGVAGLLWRFFKVRSGRPAKSPMSVPPPYWYGWVMEALGFALLAIAVTNLSPSDFVAPGFWFVCGAAVGATVAAPGVMLVVSDQDSVRAWGGHPESARQPIRSFLGWALISFGVAGGALLLPVTVLVIRG